jgi:hypothetical protein
MKHESRATTSIYLKVTACFERHYYDDVVSRHGPFTKGRLKRHQTQIMKHVSGYQV